MPSINIIESSQILLLYYCIEKIRKYKHTIYIYYIQWHIAHRMQLFTEISFCKHLFSIFCRLNFFFPQRKMLRTKMKKKIRIIIIFHSARGKPGRKNIAQRAQLANPMLVFSLDEFSIWTGCMDSYVDVSR